MFLVLNVFLLGNDFSAGDLLHLESD